MIPAFNVLDRGDIIYVHGRTGPYLETAEGQPRLNVMEMAREGLQFEIGSAIREASASGDEVVGENVRVSTNGDYAEVNVAVSKIMTPETLRNLLLVTFRPIPVDPAADADLAEQSDLAEPAESKPPPKRRPDRVKQLEREVQFLKETHQSTLEELETSSEELRSTNEVLRTYFENLFDTVRQPLIVLDEDLCVVSANRCFCPLFQARSQEFVGNRMNIKHRCRLSHYGRRSSCGRAVIFFR